jgi:hypothetical protein
MQPYTKARVPSTGKPQVSDWVADAVARAEKRLHGFQPQPTPRDQVQKLIAAILDQRISRAQLREIANGISEGRS